LLTSSILKWPSSEQVKKFVEQWAHNIKKERADVVKVGYFGSYARGDAGVGSDLDLIIILKESKLPLTKRALEWDLTKFPVPCDLLVYTEAEFKQLKQSQPHFFHTITKEAVWL